MYTRLALFILLSSFFSCEKEAEGPSPLRSDYMLIAGSEPHDSLLYLNYSPALLIKGEMIGEPSNYFYTDADSFDFDQDGSFDLKFIFNQEYLEPDCDCYEPDCCMPFGSSSCSVETIAATSIAMNPKNGLTPARLQAGDTIDSRLHWATDCHRTISNWGNQNEWYIDDENGYLAFKIQTVQGAKYGWVRLNTLNGNAIEIYASAIEK